MKAAKQSDRLFVSDKAEKTRVRNILGVKKARGKVRGAGRDPKTSSRAARPCSTPGGVMRMTSIPTTNERSSLQ